MSSRKEKKLSSKEDKKINSMLFLMKNNDNKLDLIEKLDKFIKNLEKNKIEKGAINELKNVSIQLKHLHELSQKHIVRVNTQAKQLEEAYKQI